MSRVGIQDLILVRDSDVIRQKTSNKRRRAEMSKSLLKSQRIKHDDKCYNCLLNCTVKHDETETLWCKENKPIYCYSLKEEAINKLMRNNPTMMREDARKMVRKLVGDGNETEILQDIVELMPCPKDGRLRKKKKRSK